MRTAAPLLIPWRRVSQQSGRGRVSRPVDPSSAPGPAPPASQLCGDRWRRRSRRDHTDRASRGQVGPRRRPPLRKGDLLPGTAAGVTSRRLRTDLPIEAPRDAAPRRGNGSWSWSSTARNRSAASGNPSARPLRGAFILSAPEPAPPRTNPFPPRGPRRRRRVMRGPGCGRGPGREGPGCLGNPFPAGLGLLR